jgi:hypothetical protein
MCLNKNEKAMCLTNTKKPKKKRKAMCFKNENIKKQNEMDLEPDICEKIDPVLIPFLEPDQNLA